MRKRDAVLPRQHQDNFGRALAPMFSETMGPLTVALLQVVQKLGVSEREAGRAPPPSEAPELPLCWDINNLVNNNEAARRAFYWKVLMHFPEVCKWVGTDDPNYYPLMELIGSPGGGHVSLPYLEQLAEPYLAIILRRCTLRDLEARFASIQHEVTSRHGQLTAGMVKEILDSDASLCGNPGEAWYVGRLKALSAQGLKLTARARMLLAHFSPVLAAELP